MEIKEEDEIKHKNKLQKTCREFCAILKFLYWKYIKENKETEARHYNDAKKKIEIIQERRHLELIGEKGGYKKAYQDMLEIIEGKYANIDSSRYTSEEAMKVIEEIINEIEELSKENGIELRQEKEEEIER